MGALGPYSPIRKAGDNYFISGQVGVNADKKAAADVQEQCKQALENLKDLLKSADLTLADVVKTTVFLKDIGDFQMVNEVYMSYFPEPRPARTCLAVSSLPKVADHELLVEIEAVAYKGSTT